MKFPRVLILAGGLGTRLKDITLNVPKPMVEIAGKPFLDYLLEDLSRQGIKEITLLVGHKKEIIIDHFGNTFKNLNLEYALEENPLGTGGALKSAIEMYPNEDEFIVVNGDTFFGIDYKSFLSQRKGLATLALSFQKDISRYGNVILNSDNQILQFKEKIHNGGDGFINGGIVYIKRTILESMMADVFSFERDILEKMAPIGIYGVQCIGSFIDIGTPASYLESQTLFPKWFPKI